MYNILPELPTNQLETKIHYYSSKVDFKRVECKLMVQANGFLSKTRIEDYYQRKTED